jgi:hypothetical protein
MEEALKKIRTAHQEIWTEEPSEIKRLTSIKGAWDQGASTVLFAATKLATLITFLNHMREIAQGDEGDLETMKMVTEPYLQFHASVYGNHYQLADTARVVSWAAEGVSEIDTLTDYATLMGELAIYLNRIDYWVDMKIPWARFGRVFEGDLAE